MNGRTADVYAVGELRIWRMVLAAPYRLWSANDTHRESPYKTADMRKAWRTHTYHAIKAAGLPQGLARVSFSFAFHFTDAARRDSLNYADTVKPIIDAFGPPFVQKPTAKKPGGASAPGASVIADDTDAYVEAIDLSIGPLWQDVITADGWRLTLADVNALDRGWGGVTVVLGERPALPPQPKRKRTPLAKVIPAEVRQRLAREVFLGG